MKWHNKAIAIECFSFTSWSSHLKFFVAIFFLYFFFNFFFYRKNTGKVSKWFLFFSLFLFLVQIIKIWFFSNNLIINWDHRIFASISRELMIFRLFRSNDICANTSITTIIFMYLLVCFTLKILIEIAINRKQVDLPVFVFLCRLVFFFSLFAVIRTKTTKK